MAAFSIFLDTVDDGLGNLKSFVRLVPEIAVIGQGGAVDKSRNDAVVLSEVNDRNEVTVGRFDCPDHLYL